MYIQYTGFEAWPTWLAQGRANQHQMKYKKGLKRNETYHNHLKPSENDRYKTDFTSSYKRMKPLLHFICDLDQTPKVLSLDHMPHLNRAYGNADLQSSPSLDRFIKHNCNKLWTEAMSDPKGHYRSWGLPVLYVEMVKNYILRHRKTPRWLSASGEAQHSVMVQVRRDSRWFPSFVCIPRVWVIVTWIRWSWDFKSRYVYFVLHTDQCS